MEPDLVNSIIVIIFGLCAGSFASVLTHRIPENKSIVKPPSMCDYCASPLAPRDLIPVFSFIFSKGMSRCCSKKISIQYPLIELATASLFLLSYLSTGFSLKFASLVVLSTLSVPLTLIDLRIKRLPNVLTLFGFLGGIAIAIISAVLEKSPTVLYHCLLIILISTLVFFLIHQISKGGMGMGDVKLAAMLAALTCIFDWRVMFVGMFFAFLIGAVVGILMLITKKATRKSAIPFGPFMIFGIWTALIVGPDTLNTITKLWALNN